MSNTDRIWVYQANRAISDQEKQTIEQILTQEITQWNAHGLNLQGYFELVENQILLIGAKNAPSGCSIDASTRFVQKAGNAVGVDFMDRQLWYQSPEGLKPISPFKIKEAVLAKTLTENTQIVDIQSQTADIFKPAAESWLKKYFL